MSREKWRPPLASARGATRISLSVALYNSRSPGVESRQHIDSLELSLDFCAGHACRVWRCCRVSVRRLDVGSTRAASSPALVAERPLLALATVALLDQALYDPARARRSRSRRGEQRTRRDPARTCRHQRGVRVDRMCQRERVGGYWRRSAIGNGGR